MPIHPVIGQMLDGLSSLNTKALSEQTPAEARAQMIQMRTMTPSRPVRQIGKVTDRLFDGEECPIPVRHYRPASGVPVARIVYFHGGGWVVGDIESADGLCRSLAAEAQSDVYSVDYRLAPEHPFPAALYDGWSILNALADEAGPPLVVVGDSAGGNIAAALCHRARDENGPAVAAQVLYYPVTDSDLTRASYAENGDKGWIVSTADMEWFWGHYIASPNRRDDALASVLRAGSHARLPPALIFIPGNDPLRDEGLAYAGALEREGTPVQLIQFDDMVHGFVSFGGVVDRADEALVTTGDWIRAQIAAPAKRGNG